MSFNSLPNETLQRIVDLCHEADETYQKRVGDRGGVKQDSNKGDFLKDPCKAWRGKSCSAISMINKRLRSMAIKYIFTTLRASRSRECIFRRSILGSATGDCIRSLIFDDPYAKDAITFISDTCTLLPNLRSMSMVSQATFENMGLARCLHSHWKDLEDRARPSDRIRAREAILRIAPQIIEWDMDLAEEDAALLLNTNYNGVRSLSLGSWDDPGSDMLESEQSGFVRLLHKLPNLQTLSIHQAHEDVEPDLEIVHDSILSLSFPFATSLRNLSLDLEREYERTTPNELAFATMFPNLESLKMRFRSDHLSEIDQESAYLLPKLTSLEIVNCPFLHLHKLLHVFSLPSISSIQSNTAIYPFHLPNPYDQSEEIRQLVAELRCYTSTLRSLRLQFTWNLPSLALDYLVPLASTIDVVVVSKPSEPEGY